MGKLSLLRVARGTCWMPETVSKVAVLLGWKKSNAKKRSRLGGGLQNVVWVLWGEGEARHEAGHERAYATVVMGSKRRLGRRKIPRDVGCRSSEGASECEDI